MLRILSIFTLTVIRAILLSHKKSALPSDSLGVAHLIRAYQVNGQTAAKLDPLNMHVKESFPSRPSNTYPSSDMVDEFPIELTPSFHGFDPEKDLDRELNFKGSHTGTSLLLSRSICIIMFAHLSYSMHYPLFYSK